MNSCEALTRHALRAGIVSGCETIDAIVAEVSNNKLLYPAGVRADAEFLTSEGELVMRIRQGMNRELDDDAEAEDSNAGYGGHGGQGGQRGHGSRGGGQDRKGKGISTTFGTLSSRHPVSTPTIDVKSRGFREEEGFGMYTPLMNQRTQPGNAWEGEMRSTPKWKGKDKEVDPGFGGYGYGGGGGGWSNTHNPRIYPQTPRAYNNAGPSYLQNPYISTHPNTPGGQMNNTHNSHHHPQTPRAHNNAGPCHHHREPTNADPLKSEMSGKGTEKGSGGVEGEAGPKIPFFDKQWGVWREVEVVDLGDE